MGTKILAVAIFTLFTPLPVSVSVCILSQGIPTHFKFSLKFQCLNLVETMERPKYCSRGGGFLINDFSIWTLCLFLLPYSPLMTAVLGIIILSPLFVLIYLPSRSYEDPLLYGMFIFYFTCLVCHAWHFPSCLSRPSWLILWPPGTSGNNRWLFDLPLSS